MGVRWARYAGGVCVFLLAVLVCVVRTKKLFLYKPRTSPPPTPRRENVLPRRENVLPTPLPSCSDSMTSIELFS